MSLLGPSLERWVTWCEPTHRSALRTGESSYRLVEFISHTNGLIPEGNITAYSRGRWRQLYLEG